MANSNSKKRDIANIYGLAFKADNNHLNQLHNYYNI